MTYKLVNISMQHIPLLKVDKDNNLEIISLKPYESIDITTLSDYVNIINLIDPSMGLLKVSSNY